MLDSHLPHRLPKPPLMANVALGTALYEGLGSQAIDTFDSLLTSLKPILPLLDAIPNAVFFIKDLDARYQAANLTLALRCGFKSIEPLLDKTSAEVFPTQMGSLYTEQDLLVLRQGANIRHQLELHLYGSREPGWCLTSKLPLRDQDGRIVGMAGISVDLLATRDNPPVYERLAAVDNYIREHYNENISLVDLTEIAQLSAAQLERYCKRIFYLTPRQMIHKVRLEHAHRLLQTDQSITEIALQCGYTDHSAFSRQFKALTGLSPRQYRQAMAAA
ncbi:AraC family transcriptional regulator [Burkholderia sp. WAC0059]|uniref:AraC family transcriptional regulator n=1 Tax=Burkholderia sp. WAC0059 TaxID=2066022 RepID=UPI000C7F6CF3|nr:AraC family transcriptional regulator [Burkholderia sp. WAC0059]PLZ02386.1 AraC family transcriptional regulator [Burkholderia sp. WAC0059]